MGRPPVWDEKIKSVMSDGRFLSAQDLIEMGLSRKGILSLVERGVLIREVRGMYALAESYVSDPLAVVAKRYGGSITEPRGVLCLGVAAHIHGLTDMALYNLDRMEVSMPPGSKQKAQWETGVRILQWRTPHPLSDLEWHEFRGAGIHVTNPERTVAELYAPWAPSLGEGAALEALSRLANSDMKKAKHAVYLAEKLGWGERISRDFASIQTFQRFSQISSDEVEGIAEVGGMKL